MAKEDAILAPIKAVIILVLIEPERPIRDINTGYYVKIIFVRIAIKKFHVILVLLVKEDAENAMVFLRAIILEGKIIKTL